MSEKENTNRFKVFEVQADDMVIWMGEYSNEHDALIKALKCMNFYNEIWDTLISTDTEPDKECSITINIKPLDTENGKVIQFARSDYKRIYGKNNYTSIYIIDTDPT